VPIIGLLHSAVLLDKRLSSVRSIFLLILGIKLRFLIH